MQKVLVSACLLGEKVRYDGGDCRQRGILALWQQQGRVIPFCPEVVGGLSVPRDPAEIQGPDADAVLAGRATILTRGGRDVTDAFLVGAEKALAECGKHHIRLAVLKEGSPSCGVTCINDGYFTGNKIPGRGVTACLLQRHGILVFSEMQLEAAANSLVAMEDS